MAIGNISDYILEDKIGGGAFSGVYRAKSSLREPPHGSVVAIKALSEKIIGSEGNKVIKQFEREADIAMRMNHENVVKVYEWGKINGRYAIVMEYVEGKNLYDFLHEHEKYSFKQLLEIGCKIGKGLIHIHRHGIVHKDIKPENVLVSNDLKTVKITDFGIAKFPRKWWQRDFFDRAGTERRYSHISYAPPEQKLGLSDNKSDIYSLGVLIDEMFLAKLDIPGKNEQDYFRRISEVVLSYRKAQAILSERIPIPEETKKVLRIATQESPENRYSDSEAFTTALCMSLAEFYL